MSNNEQLADPEFRFDKAYVTIETNKLSTGNDPI